MASDIMTPITILDNEYPGFEAAVDIERDISEMWMEPEVVDIPSEYQGTIRVVVTYIPDEADPPSLLNIDRLRHAIEGQVLGLTANMTREQRRHVLLAIANGD